MLQSTALIHVSISKDGSRTRETGHIYGWRSLPLSESTKIPDVGDRVKGQSILYIF